MLVLIATNELQGLDPHDYAHTVEGELVTPLVVECADGDRCGCSRGFPGLASAGATTTAMIVRRPGVTEADLRDAVYDWLDRGGWLELLEQTAMECTTRRCGPRDDVVDIHQIVHDIIDEHVELIHEVCATFPEGTVITRRRDSLRARSLPSAA